MNLKYWLLPFNNVKQATISKTIFSSGYLKRKPQSKRGGLFKYCVVMFYYGSKSPSSAFAPSS